MVEIAVSKIVMNNDGAEVNRLKIFLTTVISTVVNAS